MAPVAIPREQHFVLYAITWPQYQAFAKVLDERRVRMTYDQGKLEFMTVSHKHERWSELLGRFIGALTEELNMPCQSGGSTTLDREDVKRALEPDKCFYFQNEPLVRGKDEIDLPADPPPDLAIEVEISRSALDRMGIYAALGVPEVWRFDGDELRVYHLGVDGRYAEAEHSLHFPFVPLKQVEGFLHRRGQMDETSLIRAFRQWVREQIAAGWPAQGKGKRSTSRPARRPRKGKGR